MFAHNVINRNFMQKKAKKQLPPSQRKRYFGLTVLREGKKMSWVSQQNKNGWALGLALEKRTVWLRNIRFQSRKDVTAALKGKVVFLHLKHPVAK